MFSTRGNTGERGVSCFTVPIFNMFYYLLFSLKMHYTLYNYKELLFRFFFNLLRHICLNDKDFTQ